ncbi:hypothetical protein ACOMHN_048255 [Nucella lapillus]
MRYSRDQLLEIQPSTPNFELVNRLRELRLGVGLPRKRGCRGGRKKLRSIQVVPSRNLHPLMVPPFLQPHPDLQSAVGNAPLSSKHPTHLPTTDCLLSITPLMGGQPSDAPALSPPSPLQQGGQSSNTPALSPPSPLPQGSQPIALALSPSSPLPQDGQPSDAPGLSPSSSTLLLCPSDSTLSICHLNSQSAVKTVTTMGKNKMGHNWRARTQPRTHSQPCEGAQVEVEDMGGAAQSGEGSNALVLPGTKRKREREDEVPSKTRRLTKKERKRLEKIKATKEKKEKRSELLEKLQAVQASQEELNLLTSIAEVHAQKFKDKLGDGDGGDRKRINTVRGSNKGKVEEKDEENAGNKQQQAGKDTLSSLANAPSEGAPVPPGASSVTQGDAACSGEGREGRGQALKPQPAVNIPVFRKPQIQAARLKLPISGEEQAIVELINENSITIVSGETGSGKTTQVPQFLYEAGYAHGSGIIGVTEPRRVAAVSMSQRVAEELNLSSREVSCIRCVVCVCVFREVSYQIRYEGNVTPDTRIKFMTDGVLLREIQQDFVLSRYSVVILDEAHERSVFTDILIGLLSRIAPYRIKKNLSPLRLVIMSATLDKVGFLQNPRLFRTTPADIDVAARQFPVHVHFAARTEEDYLAAAFRKTCEIHQKEPPGGVLIFVTGQQEVLTLCRKLKKTFPYAKDQVAIMAVPPRSRRERRKQGQGQPAEHALPEVDLSKYSSAPAEEEEEERRALASVDTADIEDFDLDDQHTQVFDPVPPGCRLCVVTTNVAETSLTIPDVTYVVDTGKTKTKFYDKVTGVSTFKVTWTSKASANQRSGRAGRVGPGKCYRLYSSAVYKNHFEEHAQPEICHRPVDDLVLQMKAMGISKVAAEKLLLSLGALEVKQRSGVTVKGKKEDPTPTITALGQAMAVYPVAPRYARMLAATTRPDLLPYLVIAVAALSVDELFVDFLDADKEDEDAKVRRERIKKVKKIWTDQGQSQSLGDVAMLVKGVGACESQGVTPDLCAKYGIRYKAMMEVRKLRHQLTKEVNLRVPGLNLCIDPALAPPTDLQMLELRKIIITGMADHVARLCVDPVPDASGHHRNPYQCAEIEDLVYVHPTSALYKQKKELVVYQHIHITSRPYMKGVVGVEPHWLPEVAPYHCQFSKPLTDPPPSWAEDTGKVMCCMKCTFGSGGWSLGQVRLEFPAVAERYAWFAHFLLEGRVIPQLAKYAPLLLSPPSTITKGWARLQPRTEVLKKALMTRGVASRQALLEEWKRSPQFFSPFFPVFSPISQFSPHF